MPKNREAMEKPLLFFESVLHVFTIKSGLDNYHIAPALGLAPLE